MMDLTAGQTAHRELTISADKIKGPTRRLLGTITTFVFVDVIASLVAERRDLLEHWTKQSDQERKEEAQAQSL